MTIRKGLGGLAVTAGATALLLTGMTTAAHAAGGPSGGIWRLQNVQTGLCLTDNTSKVTTSSCSTTSLYQKWDYKRVGDRIQLENQGTGRCLKPTNPFSLYLESRPCGIGTNDLWDEYFVSGKLRLVMNGNALDSDAKGNAYLKQYGDTNPYQQWYLTTSIPG
ncbi:ricin-type beta-trefoil lectin domain protein [Streptomyces sp. NPDC048659]|uniref:RICIN domain-containing protein n=1 Tax=Streptomyces sp. NPDC048659 TaxID=3155489 RepID=UPI00341FC7D3